MPSRDRARHALLREVLVVVYWVTPKTLRLLDSWGRSCIRRSRCTVRTARTRNCLELGEILLIER